mmetsp:Transcript_7264/g.15547  ORF Transcript_7264/g.15547 Transcript_7264/m.15547 type:complete len:131 (-) Transcript_7264:293-685(-)
MVGFVAGVWAGSRGGGSVKRGVFCPAAGIGMPRGGRRAIEVRWSGDEAEKDDVDHSLAGQPIKYEKDMERDAFGRDPREETKLWMSAAKEVLGSDEVVAAKAEFKPTESQMSKEQQEYTDFIARLDAKKD